MADSSDDGNRGFWESTWDAYKRGATSRAAGHVLADPVRNVWGKVPWGASSSVVPYSADVAAANLAARSSDSIFLKNSSTLWSKIFPGTRKYLWSKMSPAVTRMAAEASSFARRNAGPAFDYASSAVRDGASAFSRMASRLDSVGFRPSWGRIGGKSGFPEKLVNFTKSAVSKVGSASRTVGGAIGTSISAPAQFGLNNNPVHLTRGHAITNYLRGAFSKTGLASAFAATATLDAASEAYDLFTMPKGDADWKFSDGDGYGTEVVRAAMRAVSGLLFGVPDWFDGWRNASMSGQARWVEGPYDEQEWQDDFKKQQAADNMFYGIVTGQNGRGTVVPGTGGLNAFRPNEKLSMSQEQIDRARASIRAAQLANDRAREFRRLVANDPDTRFAIRNVTRAINMAASDFAESVGKVNDVYDHWGTAYRQSPVLQKFGESGRDAYYETAIRSASAVFDRKIASASSNNAFADIIEAKRSEAFRATFGRPESDVDAADVDEFNRTWNSDVLTDAERALFDVRAYSSALTRGGDDTLDDQEVGYGDQEVR